MEVTIPQRIRPQSFHATRLKRARNCTFGEGEERRDHVWLKMAD